MPSLKVWSSGEVTLAGLLYWDAQVADVVAKPEDHFEAGKLWMSFLPKGLEIEVDYSKLDAPIKEFKRVWNAKQLPEGREGCNDCKMMEALLAEDEQFRAEDRLAIRRYGFDRRIRDSILRDQYRRRLVRLEAFEELNNAGDWAFSSDGVAANWEFAPYGGEDQVNRACAEDSPKLVP